MTGPSKLGAGLSAVGLKKSGTGTSSIIFKMRATREAFFVSRADANRREEVLDEFLNDKSEAEMI